MKKINLTEITPSQILRSYIKKKTWNCFDWNQNIFLKPNDGISEKPLMGKIHDEEVVQSLIYLSSFLKSTFLDVGANIGLVSIAITDYVTKIICIEANPLVFKILDVNLSLNCKNFSIHNYALGKTNSKGMLYIPPKNLGGAFILEGNEYEFADLAVKDGFNTYNSINYIKQEVSIRSCRDALSTKEILSSETLLIKIDIEGNDKLVLESCLDIYRAYFKANTISIVFESHDQNTAHWVDSNIMKYDYGVYGLVITAYPNFRQPIIRRIIKLFQGEKRELKFIPLEQVSKSDNVTNFAICPNRFIK